MAALVEWKARGQPRIYGLSYARVVAPDVTRTVMWRMRNTSRDAFLVCACVLYCTCTVCVLKLLH